MAKESSKAWKAAGNENEAGGSTVIDSALADLLDHIAEEIALEYVRLMEKAAAKNQSRVEQSQNEEV